jgi:hypothetical protein
MCDLPGSTRLPVDDMKVVPCPHDDGGWALVNRRGDVLATGDYMQCDRWRGRLAMPPAA